MTKEYESEKKALIRGFGTWDTRSVTTHVLQPMGYAINIAFKEYLRGKYLKHPLIGRRGENVEVVNANTHTYNNSYTELEIIWRRLTFKVRSVLIDKDIAFCVELIDNTTRFIPLCVFESSVNWNFDGHSERKNDMLLWNNSKNEQMTLYLVQGEIQEEPNCDCQTGYLPVRLDTPVYACTGKRYSVSDIECAMNTEKTAYETQKAKYGELADAWEPMQTCLAWNEIYEPLGKRLTSNVSRIWNVDRGGFGMFCWDNFFAAMMISLDDPARGRMNAIEILNERTEEGFVPNGSNAYGRKSFDRSQPPVGSLACREIYRRDPQDWFLKSVFPMLYTWNRWWLKARLNGKLLSWGSNLYDNKWEMDGIHNNFGGALESGMDNSPMYDDDEIRFDNEKSVQKLWDVGLNGLYVNDCEILADIAEKIGEYEKAIELKRTAEEFRTNMAMLWDEANGFFYNYKTDDCTFSRRIGPTNFYALMAKAATQQQYDRMMEEHFFNTDEFAGKWILPAIGRNCKGYQDNDYWRGRIWAPLNFLTFIGMLKYPKDAARTRLVEGSLELLRYEWTTERHIHENYNAETGDGDDVKNSDKFYHWAGLLGYMSLIENGFVPNFGCTINN